MSFQCIITGYTAQELKEKFPKAFERVMQKEKEECVQFDYDCMQDTIILDYKEKLNEAGWGDVEINYSGFWSQGDGARFECNTVIKELFIRFYKEKQENKEHVRPCVLGQLEDLINNTLFLENSTIRTIVNNHHYCHSNTVTLDFDYDMDEIGIDDDSEKYNYTDLLDEFEKWCEDERIHYCGQIYRDLEKAYDDVTDNKYVEKQLTEREPASIFDKRGEFICLDDVVRITKDKFTLGQEQEEVLLVP